MTKALDYIEKELGFHKIGIDFVSETIGYEYSKNFIFVHFERKIVFSWTPGFDPSCYIGELTGKEEREIYNKECAENHILDKEKNEE